ncbi:MAG TPA: phosphoribosyltransferase family protein [Acidimicrobiales bacterium]|nr:phosphoribosyltransferase family protein [Acidimicrobiales bacterium]
MAIPRLLLDTLLPAACPVCGRPGAAPCRSCWLLLRPAPPGPVPRGLDGCRSLLAYEGVGRELVARLKYRNARSAVAWLAAGMAGLVARSTAAGSIDVVTWAPTTAQRRRRRGFDQAELLARDLARELVVPCAARLWRGPGPPQTGRSRAERWHGPTFAPRRGPPGGDSRVLLVDDLLTTGATLTAAAGTLRAAGAATIHAVTAGRTPLKVVATGADP